MSNTTKTFLHEVLQKPISGSRPKGGVSVEGDIPSFGGENITMSGAINFYPVRKITTEFFDSMKRGHLKDLDVIINKDGANTGKSAIYRNSPYSKAAINEHLFILRGARERIDQVYLHYSLLFTKTKSAIEAKIIGSAQPGLNSNFIQNLPVKIFPLPEQKKIASILTSVDEVIENTQKQIEKLRNLKKATMNELLTKGIGHTEFRDSELGRIPKSWKVRSLEDVCLKIQDGTHFSPTLNGGDFKYITSKNIRMGEINLADVETISRNEHEKIYKRCDVKIKDLLLTKDGANTGNIAMNTLDEEFSLLSSVAFLRPSEQVNGEYLLQFMMSEKAQNQIAELMSGNAIRRLTLAKIRKFKVVFPGCQEQRQIASILSSTDKRLKYLRRKSLKTQFLKKSLMQDLLTGKVRVKVN